MRDRHRHGVKNVDGLSVPTSCRWFMYIVPTYCTVIIVYCRVRKYATVLYRANIALLCGSLYCTHKSGRGYWNSLQL